MGKQKQVVKSLAGGSKFALSLTTRFVEGLGVLVAAAGVYLFLCLLSFNPADPSFNSSAQASTGLISNAGGLVGAHLSDLLLQVFGVGAYVLVGLMLLASARMVLRMPVGLRTDRAIAYLLGLVSASILIQIALDKVEFGGKVSEPGGVVGALVGGLMVDYLNVTGAILFGMAVLFLSGLLISGGTIVGFVYRLRLGMWWTLRFITAACSRSIELAKKSYLAAKIRISDHRKGRSPSMPLVVRNTSTPQKESGESQEQVASLMKQGDQESAEVKESPGILDIVRQPEPGQELKPKIVLPHFLRSKKERKKPALPPPPTPTDGAFRLPPLSLLETEEQKSVDIDESALTRAAE